MAYGSHSAMKSTIAITTAVEMSIAQLLSVLSVFKCKLRSWRTFYERETGTAGYSGSNEKLNRRNVPVEAEATAAGFSPSGALTASHLSSHR
jgi:hypothetical protein